MLERVSQRIFQLPEADQDCWRISLEWGRDRNYILPRAAGCRNSEALYCSLPALAVYNLISPPLARRAADPLRPQACRDILISYVKHGVR
jgi:hypothetical protein